jgi:hypothetical protein
LQLGEPSAYVVARRLGIDRGGEQREDGVISTEHREVLEREVDGARDDAGAAQFAQLVELSLAAGHDTTMRRSADRTLRYR